jgi:hypothetical protein
MSGPWPWLVLAGLGAFHGLNPAMGWLFAVALGLHRRSRASVLSALPPIAFGHALSIAMVAGAFATAGVLVNQRVVQVFAGVLLMKTGQAGLVVWSFLMATAHGAGLMMLPAMIPLCLASSSAGEMGADGLAGTALAAVAVHTAAMLVVTAAVAVIVYEWLGLSVLRNAWLNPDLLWTAALAGTGLVLLLLA